ncbi:hypothetical protein Dimus_023932 [Dionaea muscipula]
MAEVRPRRASFCNQAHALLRKNIIYQKRQRCETCTIFLCPLVVLALLRLILQFSPSTPNTKVSPHICNNSALWGSVGQNDFDPESVQSCEFPSPQKWPPMLQIPMSDDRAVRTSFMSYSDLPDRSCKKKGGSCPVTILITGSNQTLGQGMAGKMFPDTSFHNSSSSQGSLSQLVLGSTYDVGGSYLFDYGVLSPLYLQKHCGPNSSFSMPFRVDSEELLLEFGCVQGLDLWRNSSSEINDELFRGYSRTNSAGKTNAIAAAFDFQNSNEDIFNTVIWYNSTNKLTASQYEPPLLRVPRLINLASDAYLQILRGSSTKIIFEFIKEMPTHHLLGYSSGGISFFQLLSALALVMQFQVVAKALVYEKQRNVRMMMKMNGLGNKPYWTITYAFHLILTLLSMLCYLVGGKLLGIYYFTENDFSIQFVFYFLFANLQVSSSFLAAAFCSSIRTVTVVNLLAIFVGVSAAAFLFRPFLEDPTFPSKWILYMELFPFFALCRGLYEFEQYAVRANEVGTNGMQWKNLCDSLNGMTEVMVIMIIECLVFFMIAYYVDQVKSTGSGVKKSPLFFLHSFRKKPSPILLKPTLEMHTYQDSHQMEKCDIAEEREKVEQIMLESSASHAIICDNLRKVYPGRDGNPEKVAVKGLSLALGHAECFGMLGPNGAGKTSFISMMIGLTEPTSGTALVQGLDLRSSMDNIYGSMGVCPQHDLLWDCLTGREHLLFYGRLKNLRGAALNKAVKESLITLNLYNGGVADKEAGKYSGGMKRRLSVAISLIGDPKVVYMDEPSTGLDPASRNLLWNVVKRAKQDRAIVLTTHSMEEAEALCDRLGIFVNGELQCIGNSKDLKARYGGTFVFTMTTTPDHDAEVEEMVQGICQTAQKIYHLSGTQKFELPKHVVRVSDVFELVENAKRRFTVHAWGLADTTLEDVFIKVTREAQESGTGSQ